MNSSEKTPAAPTDPHDPTLQNTNLEELPADVKEGIHNVDQDDAVDLFAGTEEIFGYTDKEATRVRWKLDLILLSTMTLTYIFSFIDKVALSEASIFGIRKDDHLVGQQYSWVNSIFYFGYLIAQYPSSILMQKLPLGRYFGGMVLLWGMVTTCMATTHSFATLATCRFFLGAFETCLSPILTVLVSQYWTRKEQPLRASLWWAGGGIGSFIADGITYGVSGKGLANSKYATWQIIFLIFGPLTIGWGVFLFFFLPTSPMTAWFLSERERKIAVMRVIKNHTGIENRRYKLYQVKEALKDPQAWMLCSIAFLQCIPGGGLTSFDKIVLTGLGYSDRQATLMSFPEDAIQLFSVVVAGFAAQAIPNSRCALMILANTIVLIGAVLVDTLPENRALSRLGSFYILFVNTIPYIMCMSLVSSNIGGFTKKATCGVMMFMAYSIGQIIAPHFFLDSESPRYPTGFRAFYVCVALMIAIEFAMIAYLHYQNRKRDRRAAPAPPGTADALAYDFLDLTDREHSEFRYVY